ncbi:MULTISPECIES: hypothetical protein [Bacillaceae]|nr:hypothetical protein [Bacillus sp. AFS031507]
MAMRNGFNLIVLPRFYLQEELGLVKREQPFYFGAVPTILGIK